MDGEGDLGPLPEYSDLDYSDVEHLSPDTLDAGVRFIEEEYERLHPQKKQKAGDADDAQPSEAGDADDALPSEAGDADDALPSEAEASSPRAAGGAGASPSDENPSETYSFDVPDLDDDLTLYAEMQEGGAAEQPPADVPIRAKPNIEPLIQPHLNGWTAHLRDRQSVPHGLNTWAGVEPISSSKDPLGQQWNVRESKGKRVFDLIIAAKTLPSIPEDEPLPSSEVRPRFQPPLQGGRQFLLPYYECAAAHLNDHWYLYQARQERAIQKSRAPIDRTPLKINDRVYVDFYVDDELHSCCGTITGSHKRQWYVTFDDLEVKAIDGSLIKKGSPHMQQHGEEDMFVTYDFLKDKTFQLPFDLDRHMNDKSKLVNHDKYSHPDGKTWLKLYVHTIKSLLLEKNNVQHLFNEVSKNAAVNPIDENMRLKVRSETQVYCGFTYCDLIKFIQNFVILRDDTENVKKIKRYQLVMALKEGLYITGFEAIDVGGVTKIWLTQGIQYMQKLFSRDPRTWGEVMSYKEPDFNDPDFMNCLHSLFFCSSRIFIPPSDNNMFKLDRGDYRLDVHCLAKDETCPSDSERIEQNRLMLKTFFTMLMICMTNTHMNHTAPCSLTPLLMWPLFLTRDDLDTIWHTSKYPNQQVDLVRTLECMCNDAWAKRLHRFLKEIRDAVVGATIGEIFQHTMGEVDDYDQYEDAMMYAWYIRDDIMTRNHLMKDVRPGSTLLNPTKAQEYLTRVAKEVILPDYVDIFLFLQEVLRGWGFTPAAFRTKLMSYAYTSNAAIGLSTDEQRRGIRGQIVNEMTDPFVFTTGSVSVPNAYSLKFHAVVWDQFVCNGEREGFIFQFLGSGPGGQIYNSVSDPNKSLFELTGFVLKHLIEALPYNSDGKHRIPPYLKDEEVGIFKFHQFDCIHDKCTSAASGRAYKPSRCDVCSACRLCDDCNAKPVEVLKEEVSRRVVCPKCDYKTNFKEIMNLRNFVFAYTGRYSFSAGNNVRLNWSNNVQIPLRDSEWSIHTCTNDISFNGSHLALPDRVRNGEYVYDAEYLSNVFRYLLHVVLYDLRSPYVNGQ